MILSITRVLLLLIATLHFDGCSKCGECGHKEHVAELISSKRTVLRDFAQSPNQWKKADPGDLFRMDEALKTGPGASALLSLYPEGQMRVESDTIVRFQATASGEEGHRLDIETGSVEIESREGDLQIHTVVGRAKIEKGSRVRMRSDTQSYNMEVLVGGIQIEKGGQTVEVPSGEDISIDIGAVTISEREKDDAKESLKEKTTSAGEDAQVSSDSTSMVTEDVEDKSESEPSVADLSISAGESCTIHDPSPPTQIRIPFSRCPDGGLLQVGLLNRNYRYTSSQGGKGGIVRLPKGRYQYRIRCVKNGKPLPRSVARGRINILHDSALRQLPKNAPRVTVEADGRTYTVRFQNRLPQLTLKWPDPPSSQSYTIYIKAADGGKHSQKGKKPLFNFKSGQFREGSFGFYFITAEGRRSPPGKLRIAFDNLARTAYVSAPVESQPTPGQTVHVAGAALPQSSVRVAGKSVSTDHQGRFQTQIIAPGAGSAISIRVAHRATGLHYYLRHVKSIDSNHPVKTPKH